MPRPKLTADIYETLNKGNFICSNSVQEHVRRMYDTIEENFEQLYEYFIDIDLILESGSEYYYFSRRESKTDLDRKLDNFSKWLDVLDFLKTFNNSFGAGYRFTPSDILVQIKVDAELKSKLEGLKRHIKEDRFEDILKKLMENLRREGFIEVENEISGTFKVMTSFRYLEDLILSITIPEETLNEIPE